VPEILYATREHWQHKMWWYQRDFVAIYYLSTPSLLLIGLSVFPIHPSTDRSVYLSTHYPSPYSWASRGRSCWRQLEEARDYL